MRIAISSFIIFVLILLGILDPPYITSDAYKQRLRATDAILKDIRK